MDTFNLSATVALGWPVCAILRSCSAPEVAPAIISRVLIDMVDVRWWLLASHNHPRETMGLVEHTVDHNAHITPPRAIPCHRPNNNLIGDLLPPAQQTGFWLVVQNLPNALNRYFPTPSHTRCPAS